MDFNVIVERATRALKSDETVFTEAGADEPHTGSAAVLVAIIGLVSGLLTGTLGSGSFGSGLFGGIIGAFIGWFIGTGIFYLLAKMFSGEGDYMHLLRGNAYAAVPSALSGIPVIGIAALLYSAWLYVLSVKGNMNLSTGSAVAVVAIPLVILFILAIILVVLVGVALVGFSSTG